MWWQAYFCLMATGLLTKWVSARISWWPTVAADSLGGPFWGLGGSELWTRDLCCLFTFSWFRSLWLTTVLLCQHHMFHLDLFMQVCYVHTYKGGERNTQKDRVFMYMYIKMLIMYIFVFVSNDWTQKVKEILLKYIFEEKQWFGYKMTLWCQVWISVSSIIKADIRDFFFSPFWQWESLQKHCWHMHTSQPTLLWL